MYQQEGVINNYRRTVGEIQRPECDLNLKRSNNQHKINRDVSDDSSSVINKYYKVKNSPIKSPTKSNESFQTNRTVPKPRFPPRTPRLLIINP